MKNFIRLLSMAALAFITTAIYAQQPPAGAGQNRQGMGRATVEETVKAQVDWMTTDLQLNEATVEKVAPIVTKYTQARQDEISKVMSSGGNFESITTITNDQYAKMDAELKQVLGDATYEKYVKIVAEKRAASGPMGPRQGGQPGGGMPAGGGQSGGNFQGPPPTN